MLMRGEVYLIRDRLLRDMAFIVELDKMKSIHRQTSIIGKDVQEDDAQHSWHISIMAMVLAEYSNEELDVLKAIKMLLTHDLVEIYAGDTFCYDKQGNMDKKERETEAAEKIFGILEDDKKEEFKALWEEFEEMETPEALFAASMDRIQPMLSNFYNDGGTWKKYEVAKEDIYERIAPVKKASDELWNYVEFMIEDACHKGLITKRKKMED